jgi:uncharacterized membrane protein
VILELFELGAGDVERWFDRGHVAVSGTWALLGLAAVVAGLVRRARPFTLAGLVWLGVTLMKLGAYDAWELGATLRSWSFLAVAACVLLAGYAYQLLGRRERPLDWVAVVGSLVPLGLALVALATLVEGHAGGVDLLGLALLGLAVVYGAFAAGAFRLHRDLSTLLWGLALVVAAGAEAILVSGDWLTLAWGGSAAALTWLAVRVAERRFQLAALGYLVLAFGWMIGEQSPPTMLLRASEHPAIGIGSVAIVVAATALFARLCLFEDARWRSWSGWSAALVAVYGLSLAILELFELGAGDVDVWFDRGHVAVSGTWALLGLAAVVAGLVRTARPLTLAGLTWLGVTLLKLGLYDGWKLDATLRSWSFLAVGACVLLAGYAYQLLGRREGPLDLVAVVGSLVPFGLALSALTTLVEGHAGGVDLLGLALLGLAVVYGALSAGAFRAHRDLGTLLWTLALAVAAGAEAILVSGGWLTLAWGGSAAALTWLAVRLEERRLQLAALGYLVLAFGWMIGEEAPPTALLRASEHPAVGIGSVAIVVAATALFSRLSLFEDARWRSWSGWAAGILAVYGLSLVILELFELAPADVHTDFQRGHTGVSAFWGALGLALLYVGLTRRERVLRLGGFALFGISLVKLFVYDLAFLNSVARALSFLAVGAVLLLGGFFYQRLSARLEGRPS